MICQFICISIAQIPLLGVWYNLSTEPPKISISIIIYQMTTFDNLWLESGYPDWKPVGKRNRHLIFLDRMMAIPGSLVFTVLYLSSIVVIPSYFILWFAFHSNPLWSLAGIYLGLVSFVSFQSIAAYLRQSYFYDSYGVYEILGFLFFLFLMIVTNNGLRYARERFGFEWWVVWAVDIIQVIQAIHACMNTA